MNAFLAVCQQLGQVLPCCLPPACGMTASSLGSCSSPNPWVKSAFVCCALFFPFLCSITIFQASTTVMGALGALSQHCTVRRIFGNCGFQDDKLNSLYPTESGMLGQCLSGQIWRPHWARFQPNAGQTDGSSSRSLKPGKPTGMPAHLTYLVECPWEKLPGAIEGGSTWL